MPVKYKNPGRIEFTGEIRRAEGGGALVIFPHDVEKLYGVKGRVPVRVSFDGIPYRGSMVKMGGPSHILLILKEIRERLEKDRGDKIKVVVELDEAPRVVKLAPDIEAAYKKAGVLEPYRAMSFSHQREYALWIEEAKQAETRARRIAKSVDDLKAKKNQAEKERKEKKRIVGAGVKYIALFFSLAPFMLSSLSPESSSAAPVQKNPTRMEVLAAMKKSTRFIMEKVSNRGGFLYTYAADFSEQWGEIPARKSQIWVQPPGTPSMGEVFLEAYEATGDVLYLECAEKAAKALIYGQHPLGGWHYFIDFDPKGIAEYYEKTATKCWGWEEYYHYYGNCTFDDEVQTGPARFLMNLYLATLDPRYKQAVDKALSFVLISQFANGAWPQRFPLHDGYTSYYTFNDEVIPGNIDLLLEAYEKLGDVKYREAALRGMDFVMLSQLSPPQAGWCQQFSHDMKPAKARNYEPAAVEPGVTVRCIRDLETYYRLTGEKKYLLGIPDAIAWLEASVINRDKNKTYEGRPYTHAAFYEPGTNRPIYVHRKATLAELDPKDPNRGYWVDYEFGNFPGHYGMTANLDLEALKKEFERIKSLTPEEAIYEYRREKERAKGSREITSENLGKIAEITSKMDAQGAWIEDVFIPYYPDFRDRAKGKTIRAIRTQTYQNNMRMMISYIKAMPISK